MALHVESEVGRLRRVLVYRPGAEIDRMVPGMIEHLLFDDILQGAEARAEHDSFCRVLEAAGVEVLNAGELLAEVLESESPKLELLEDLERFYGVPSSLATELRQLAARELAAALIEGVRPNRASRGLRRRDFFSLAPSPNYFFQRDPQIVLGSRVVFSSMATDAREREPLLARTLFRYHPLLSGSETLFEIDRPHHGSPDQDLSLLYPTLEGGDVLVASPETLLVGLSERTNRRGVQVLAEYLRRETTTFRNLIVVELPARRAFMHLDTVFTLIDKRCCLAYLPVVEAGGGESAHVYAVSLDAPELTLRVRPSLLEALADVGMQLEVVPCGGDDLIDQQREQWTDGANAFTVAPGVIMLYRRNRRTLRELARRGWRILTEESVVAGEEGLLEHGPTVVGILGNELSRARGGPRCMTMPLERDPV